MQWRGRNLVIIMPTDRRALVDLLLYLEKNFSALPQEICGRSLAFELLHTMRLSLRKMRNTENTKKTRTIKMNPAQREERRAFNEAMRARIRLIAQERNLPDSEIKWMGRLATRDLVSFMTRHNASADWLLCGDLKGLLKTVRCCVPGRNRRHEAPAPIDQKAQPATVGRPCKAVEAVTATRGARA
jgi:hypothetical protein